MQTAMLYLHSTLRWILLVFLIVSILKGFTGWQGKKNLTDGDKKLWLFTMISAHVMLLIGLYLLFFGRMGIITSGVPQGISVMKDKAYRFYWVEHPFGMILSVLFITLGRAVVKKSIPDPAKYKKAFWFFLLALIFILATVPWPFRDIIGRPWFPGIQ